ncbi:MAG: (deoxy)nucleoside triphosphate pyrophosphohydrolase [Planctomycetota bacterium]
MPDPPHPPARPGDPPLIRVSVAAILRAAPNSTTDPPSDRVYSVADRWSILLTRRRATTVYGGYWELPGGKIESDETPEAAARREVREEIGCAVRPERVLAPIEHVYEHARVRLHCVLCRLEGGSPEPRDLEVEAHAWTRLSELPWEAFLPANVRLVTALCRSLGADPL